MRILRVLRLARHGATILLLAALVLPLARCGGQRNGESDQRQGPPAYTYYYAWSEFDPLSPGSWLIFVIFAWPVAILLYEVISRRPASFIWLRAMQVLLSMGSVYFLYLRTFLYELWYGGYIAYAALSTCLLVSLAELVLIVRIRLRQRLSPPGARRL